MQEALVQKKKVKTIIKKVIVEARVTVHWPKCIVHVPWIVQEALVQKKKEKETDTDVGSAKCASQMHTKKCKSSLE